MKYIFTIGLLLALFACKDETRENPPLRGQHFYLGNPWKFYFVDEEGKGMLHPVAGSELPTSYLEFRKEKVPELLPESAESPLISYGYNNSGNTIAYDAERGIYYWMTVLEGYEWVNEYEFYVGFSTTDTDTIRVHFRFITGEDCVGSPLCAEALTLYYNGTAVIRNGDYTGNQEGIFIVKSGY